MNSDTITILILFLAIIGISMWISTKNASFVPFSGSAKYGAVEGFTSIGYSDVPSNLPINDTSAANKKCVQVAGWQGAFCGTNSDSEILDIYSRANGKLGCEGSGYHNSKGSLCMDENMKRLLSTRGSNAV